MKDIKIIEVYDDCYKVLGFFSITFSDYRSEYDLHCCCSRGAHSYIKSIDKNDHGADDGICYDANKDAFEVFGRESCLKLLFSVARKNGFVVCCGE